MLHIAICEDLPQDGKHLKKLIQQYLHRHQLEAGIDLFDNYINFFGHFAPGAYDLLFLDIYMQGMDGVAAAKEIRAIDQQVALVFTTTSTDHAVSGFALRAQHYLVKPVEEPALAEAFSRCQGLLQAGKRVLEIKSHNTDLSLPVFGIEYIEVFDKVCQITVQRKAIKTYTSLDTLEKALGGLPFLRCHRSYLVNLNYVDRVEEKSIYMKDGALIPLPRSRRKEILQLYLDYMLEQTRNTQPL